MSFVAFACITIHLKLLGRLQVHSKYEPNVSCQILENKIELPFSHRYALLSQTPVSFLYGFGRHIIVYRSFIWISSAIL